MFTRFYISQPDYFIHLSEDGGAKDKTHLSVMGKVYQDRKPSKPQGRINISHRILENHPNFGTKQVWNEEYQIDTSPKDWEIIEYKLVKI